jgi:hypothetical protein
LVQRKPFRLFVLLIPAESKPGQTLKNRVHRGLGVALDIRIVEPQDDGSSIVAGIEPIENECPGTANVQKAGGRGSESYSWLATGTGLSQG